LKPISTVLTIASQFPGEHGDFVRSLFSTAKRGRIWYGLNPDDAARALGVERRRVVRAIEVMEERRLVEVKAGDVRTPYTRMERDFNADQVTGELLARFDKREEQEILRLRRVVDLIEHDGCQVNSLVRYFGEIREMPCGHCTWCLSKKRQRLAAPSLGTIYMPTPEVYALYNRFPPALQSPRQLAKILCGLLSPSAMKLKMTREKLFGSLEQHRFSDVVAWCETILG